YATPRLHAERDPAVAHRYKKAGGLPQDLNEAKNPLRSCAPFVAARMNLKFAELRMKFRLAGVVVSGLFAMTACGGSSSNSSSMPPVSSGTARVRFADGAPELEALINGVPQDIGNAYLQVDGQTVSSAFD